MTSTGDQSVQTLIDTETPKAQQVTDAYALIDSLKTCLLTTLNADGKLTSRAMRLQHRDEMDFWFFTNKNSLKLNDLHHSHEVNLGFLDVESGEWISISGRVSFVDDRDKVRELYSEDLKAWFADLKDGVNDGSPNDPRLTLILVRAHSIHYFIKDKESGASEFMEIVKGTLVGKIPKLGKVRQLHPKDIDAARTMASHQ